MLRRMARSFFAIVPGAAEALHIHSPAHDSSVGRWLSAALSGATNLYKIKLRQAGYRLVYSVEEAMITITVIAVGKRDRNEVYDIALSRLLDADEP